MEKFLSLFLCFSLILSMVTVSVYAGDDNEQSDIEGFINDVQRLIQKYESEKDYDVASECTTAEISADTAPVCYSAEDVSENKVDDSLELDFRTCRLVVQSNKDIDTYGAVDVVNGFKDFYVLQYTNEEDTKIAYENYLNDGDIISVDIDTFQKAFDTELSSRGDITTVTKEDFYNCWSLNATGMDKVLGAYSDKTFPDITVALIDSGVDLDHELFEGRIIRTYFNCSGDGEPDDESDVYGHGTRVSSIIVKLTPENVKIANYRVGTDNGDVTMVMFCAGVLKAVADGIKIISTSCSPLHDYELETATLEYAYSKGCFITNAAGNSSSNLGIREATALETSGYACTVASSAENNLPANTTSYGKPVQIVAPGDAVLVARIGNIYGISSGTSFASPYIAAVYAMLTNVYPNLSREEKQRMILGSTTELSAKYIKYNFYNGVINALELFGLNSLPKPTFSKKDGLYIGEVEIELFAEDGCDIYYTMDQTYPSPTKGMLYTEPIKFEGDVFGITAVAYKNGERSDFSRTVIHSAKLGTDDMFTISEDGTVTGYTGNTLYLKIPETINGIEVKDISECLFTETEILGIVLPNTITFLGDMTYWNGPVHKSFIYDNDYVKFITGNNVKILGNSAFFGCSALQEVNFPNLEAIGGNAFDGTAVCGVEFPNVTTLLTDAFYFASHLREVYLPKCTKIFDRAFKNCRQLMYVYMPLADFDVESIEYPDWEFDISQEGPVQVFSETFDLSCVDLPNLRVLGWEKNNNSFSNSCIKRMFFSKLEYLFELPYPGYWYFWDCYTPVDVELCLPSTLKYCVPVDDYLDPEERTYIVYGSKGTYAEEWAETNAVKFVELSPQTAVAENIDAFWDEYSYKPLVFDARGFNRTYQWYGSYDNKIGNDVAIKGATSDEYDPGNSSEFAYYYCRMTSTDIDNNGNVVSSFSVNSALCQNRFCYMFAKDKTEIDFDNKLIYTSQLMQKDFSNIIGTPKTTTAYDVPSYAYLSYKLYGTGSSFIVYKDGSISGVYTLIVRGDVNGDSTVDVLDVFSVSLVINGHREFAENSFLAADINCDGELTAEDYQQTVNLALCGCD